MSSKKKNYNGKKKGFKANTWNILSGEDEAKSTSCKNEKRVHPVLMVKMDVSSNFEGSGPDNVVQSNYEELYDKYEEMLGEFEKLVENCKLLRTNFGQKKDNLDSIKKIEIPILKLNVSKMQVTLSLMIAQNSLRGNRQDSNQQTRCA